MQTYTVTSPIKVKVSANKSFSLNLNQYRNAHYFTLNTAKTNYASLLVPVLKQIPKLEAVSLCYSLYLKGKRRLDINNILTVVDKFFADCLVEAGVLDDDDYSRLDHTIFRFGGFTDKESHVIIEIHKVDKTMRITLTSDEITAIVSAHLKREMNITATTDNSKLEVAKGNEVVFHVDTGLILTNPNPTKAPKNVEIPRDVDTVRSVEPEPVVVQEEVVEPEASHTTTEEVVPSKETTETPKTTGKRLFGAIKV